MTNRGDSGLGFPTGAYQATPNGAGTAINTSGNPISIFQGGGSLAQITVNETVQPGQLAVISGDNFGYYAADPNLGTAYSSLRPILQSADITNGLQTSPVALTANIVLSVTSNIATAQLPNGNWVMAWCAGSGTPWNIQFQLYDPSMVPIGTPTTVGTTTFPGPSPYLSLCVLTSGGFAIAYYNTTTSAKYAVYTAAGGVVLAATSVAGLPSFSGAGGTTLAPLQSGGFALGLNLSPTSNGFPALYMAIYSSTGTVTTAPFQVNTQASSQNSTASFSLTQLTNGNIVAAYQIVNSVSSYYNGFSIWSSTGSVVKAETAITLSNVSANVAMGVTLCALTGGGFVITGTIGAQSLVFNAAGTQQGSTFTGRSGNAYGNVVQFPTSDGGILVFANNGSGYGGAYYYKLSSAGATVIAVTIISSTSGVVGTIGATLSNGVYYVAWNDTGGTYNSCQINASTFVQTNTGITSGLTAPTGSGYGLVMPVFPVVQTIRPSTPVIALINSTGQLGFINSYVQKSTPIGVYVSGAVAGQKATFQFMGTASLAAAFLRPYTLNARGATPPGQLMNVVGNSVTMYGIQASTPRNIN